MQKPLGQLMVVYFWGGFSPKAGPSICKTRNPFKNQNPNISFSFHELKLSYLVK